MTILLDGNNTWKLYNNLVLAVGQFLKEKLRKSLTGGECNAELMRLKSLTVVIYFLNTLFV